MGLKSTRRILSIIFAAILAFSLAVTTSCIVECLTISNRSFYEKHFSDVELVKECEQQLTKKYNALSKKSNIPIDVFANVLKQYDTKQSLEQATSYLFDENDSTLNNDVRVKYFYSICTEYLDANEYSYSSENVYNACVEASRIYSDTVGIHNLEYLKNDVASRNRINTKKMSAMLLAASLCIIFTLYMYRKRLDAMMYISGGIVGGGISVILASFLKLIFNVGTVYNIEPEIYSVVFSSIYKSHLCFEALGGVCLLIAGIAAVIITQRFISREEFRKNTRFYKVVDKL